MTAPWLAPDGRPWFEKRPGHRILVPDGGSSTVWTAPRKTRVAIAARHICVRPYPIGKSRLWRLGYAPWDWEF